jgi:glycerol kinase
VRPSSGILGTTVPCGRLDGGIPVAAAIGDSHAALFGHAAFAPGA